MEKRASVCAAARNRQRRNSLVSVALIKYAPAAKTAGEKECKKMKIENKNYEISMSKAATVAEGMKSLPVFQTVRGSNQWNAEKREQFVADLAAGKYIPPIAYG